MSETYYRKNFLWRFWNSVTDFAKNLPTARVNAIAFAVMFFIVLIAFLEYKVFESTYTLTGNIILSISVLGVTAFGGVLAEIVLHRNQKATDDQLLIADWLFYISLLTSAIAGFGIWAQASGANNIVLTNQLTIALPEFASFVFLMITVVSVVDILLLRGYIRADVDAVHARNVSRANSKKREADLDVSKSLIDFEADVKSKSERILSIEKRRKEIKDQLEEMYGGSVPANIMKYAMDELDKIMSQVANSPAPALASDVKRVELQKPKPQDTKESKESKEVNPTPADRQKENKS